MKREGRKGGVDKIKIIWWQRMRCMDEQLPIIR
jgi:hypothetical protein